MDVSMVESIESTGISGKRYQPVSMTDAAAAPIKKESSNEDSSQEKPINNDTLKKIAENIQEQISVINSSLSFQVYGKDNDRYAIIVSDKTTGKIIREIPSKEVQQMQAKLDELIGMIFNGLA
jgi:flagellar protein FlaG